MSNLTNTEFTPPHPQSNNIPHTERPRKRRRRTIACTQCRSRKLRCDREFPTCGRCQKSKTPTNCTYEDGFLWQQPNTVSSTVFSDPGSTVARPAGRGDLDQGRPPVNSTTSPDSALRALPRPRVQPPSALGTHPGMSAGRPLQPPPVQEKRDRFLETVLGAPKAAINQEPYVNTELLQRPRQNHSSNILSRAMDGEEDDGLASPSQELDISPRIMMRGKETKTRFNGSGIFANLMSQFPDMKPFAEEIRLSYPNLARFRPDLERVKRGLWKGKPLSEPIPMPDTRSLILLLPSRRVVDELIGLYMTYIESTHRILHMPSFLRELEQFWTRKENPNMVSPAFVAQLLLVLSCAWNLVDQETLQSLTDVSLNCYTALEWVLHTEKWLVNADIKRPEITALRLYILLITAQNCHGMKRSKAWLATGTLVKQAMLSGYHRDPSRYTKISVFNREMRRRVWTTIVELDLQIAIDRGMPPSVQASDYDTAAPLNINDEDIHETITELPAERPLTEVTSSSFQAVFSKSLPLRLKACALMHSPQISCRYDEILRMDWELSKHLSTIPAWETSETDHIATQHKVILLRSLLETRIGQSLLCIHTPFAVEAQKEPVFAPSARARMEVATMVLSTQRRLHETSRVLSLCNMGDWTLQACCSILQLLHARDNIRASSTTFLSRTLDGFPEFLLSLVETILICLESRLVLVVKGAKEYFFMSTILSLVKVKLWPAQAPVYKQQVVDRILLFAQTLFTRHANCNHLGDPGMGSFSNQVASFPHGATPGAGLVAPSPIMPGLDGSMLPPTRFGVTPPGDFDPFLDVFDWEDLTGIVLRD